jgi:hypothetical protein
MNTGGTTHDASHVSRSLTSEKRAREPCGVRGQWQRFEGNHLTSFSKRPWYGRAISAPTCYFLCPDFDVPSGGIRVIYRFVDILNAFGIKAAVIHKSRKFRCTWFENSTNIVGARDIRFQKGDLLVLPEWYRALIPALADGIPNLILNQNAYEMFTDVPFERGKEAPIVSSDTVGIVGISKDNLRYLRLCFPSLRVDEITLSIDSKLFHPSHNGKSKTIAFMPRKRLKELNQILHVLQHRGSLDGWELQPIKGVTEIEAARLLSGAAIYLSLADREGIALPSLEAMASGCVVVGYHGGSAEEYMKANLAVPIPDGEITSLVESLESEMVRWVNHDEAQKNMTKAAVDLVTSTYTPERERADVVRVFSGAMERVSDISPSTPQLKTRLLPSPHE